MKEVKHRIALFWSSGKDACLALHRLRRDPQFEVVQLISTLQADSRRVNFHGTSETLLQAQAKAIGLPLSLISLPELCSNHQYETLVSEALRDFSKKGITHLAFGDLFLEDIRRYRERFLSPLGFSLCFPIWHHRTEEIAHEIIESGLKCIVSSINPKRLPPHLLGQLFDSSFLEGLPPGVDPCGENGEFHTFVFDGPMFHKALKISKGSYHSDLNTHWVDLKLKD